MRLAFNILIDRDYICENVGQTGQVAASSYIPLGMADGSGGVFKKDAEANSYYDALAKAEDPEACVDKAIEYLKAAGYKFEDGKLSDENPIVIDYLTNDGTGHVAAAESMQQDFAEIGIVINIVRTVTSTSLVRVGSQTLMTPSTCSRCSQQIPVTTTVSTAVTTDGISNISNLIKSELRNSELLFCRLPKR